MYEIRLHGRGGQGAVLASNILAKALVEEGRYAVAIPSFGFERRGAPVVAFLKTDDHEIRAMTNIYKPDCIVCIDPTVPRSVDIFAGMPAGGALVQCTKERLDQLALPPHLKTVGLCDGVGIAQAIFRRSITNTIMLGAFAKTTGMVSLEALKRSLAAGDFRDAGLKQNLEAIERGYHETQVFAPAPEVAA